MNAVISKTINSINGLFKKGIKKVSIIVDAEDKLGIKYIKDNFQN